MKSDQRRPRSSSDRRNPRNSERGASLVEYALLMALIAVVCLGAITAFGSANGGSVNNSATSIISAN